jgi:hypothetical protein
VHTGLFLQLHLKVVATLSAITIALLFFLFEMARRKNEAGTYLVGNWQFLDSVKVQTPASFFFVFFLLATPFFLHLSWTIFWCSAIFLLFAGLFPKLDDEPAQHSVKQREKANLENAVVGVFIVIWIVLALSISRSDLDDAFYAAVAANAASNPEKATSMLDPMLGETNLPLIFPSYRYASFELLSGLGGYLLELPTISFYYIYFLPLWTTASVIATFLLTKELVGVNWLLAGSISLILILLLGEMHRSPANFSFVRIYQGKAVFLSVVIPAIFYLTARFFSQRGGIADLFLLACCQLTSIGLTNFGMLMAPLAGFGAIISNLPLVLKGQGKKALYALFVLLIPLPYLFDVALDSRDSPVLTLGLEPASQVWRSVFGSHQQYVVGLLILAGSLVAKNLITRWRVCIPPLILFGLYLNPWLSNFISSYITTPPVYWRVVWSFPVLTFAGISLCLLIVGCLENTKFRLTNALIAAAAVVLLIYSLPFNTLRPSNIGKIEGFATWKIPSSDLHVSMEVIRLSRGGGRVLAPEEIAGVISRFEGRPPLISTRGFYLDLMRPTMGDVDYMQRKLLYEFMISSNTKGLNDIHEAFRMLNVSVIVLKRDKETNDQRNILQKSGFSLETVLYDYSVWVSPR